MKKSESVSCPAVSDSLRTHGLQPTGSAVHGVIQARIMEWVAIPSSRETSWFRVWTQVSCDAGRFFTTWATRKAGAAILISNRKWGVGIYGMSIKGISAVFRVCLGMIKKKMTADRRSPFFPTPHEIPGWLFTSEVFPMLSWVSGLLQLSMSSHTNYHFSTIYLNLPCSMVMGLVVVRGLHVAFSIVNTLKGSFRHLCRVYQFNSALRILLSRTV